MEKVKLETSENTTQRLNYNSSRDPTGIRLRVFWAAEQVIVTLHQNGASFHAR